jgi:hypothetical protein
MEININAGIEVEFKANIKMLRPGLWTKTMKMWNNGLEEMRGRMGQVDM